MKWRVAVGHTPASREELMRGARQRAEALGGAAKVVGRVANYFVGLEGGLDIAVENGRRCVLLESWAYVTAWARRAFRVLGEH